MAKSFNEAHSQRFFPERSGEPLEFFDYKYEKESYRNMRFTKILNEMNESQFAQYMNEFLVMNPALRKYLICQGLSHLSLPFKAENKIMNEMVAFSGMSEMENEGLLSCLETQQ